MEEQTKDISDYLIAIRKRKVAILSIMAVIFLFTVIIAFILPPEYKSSSTILIEQQEIPPELVQSTVTSYAAERIQSIQARVMSRTNLLKIIDKFNLYKDEREFKTTEEIIEEMQDNVGLDIISADVVDPRTGRPSVATIAFSLSFVGENPTQVQRVTNELTSLYLNENVSSRSQKAAETSEFFKEETQRLSDQIDELEAKLADFKTKNSNSLPELQSLNLQMLQKMESELSNLDAKLNTLNERRFYLEGQLAQMNPGNPAIPGAAERLKMLEAEYASARSKYSSEHPDVLRLKNEIDQLRQDGDADSSAALAEELSKLRAELAQKEKKYTAEHPDITSLKKKIASLNEELAGKNNEEKKFYKSQPDNPAYITLQSQLVGIDSEIKSILQQRKAAADKISKMEMDLYKAPQVEREYLILRRDYENAISRYQETKAKQMHADVAKQLESERKGERFTLIDPAALPEEPISPNRPAIIFLGFVLSVGCGFGFAFIADAISGTVRGSRGVRNNVGVLPLSVIPYEYTLNDIKSSKRMRKRYVVLFVAVILAAVLFIHFVISPIDVLWFRILRKIDILLA